MRSPSFVIGLCVSLIVVFVCGLILFLGYWPVILAASLNLGGIPRTTTDNPSFDSAYNKGMAQFSTEKPNEAIKEFTAAIEQNPQDAHGYYMRGVGEFEEEDFEPAIQDFSHSLRLKPRDPDAYAFRGQLNQMAGHLREAISDYQKEIEIRSNENCSESHLRIWFAEIEDAENREVVDQELKRFIQNVPSPLDEDDFDLKIARFVTGEISKEQLLTEVQHPKYPEDLPTDQSEAAFYIGMVELRDGNQEAARDAFRECISIRVNSLMWPLSVECRFAKKWLDQHPN